MATSSDLVLYRPDTSPIKKPFSSSLITSNLFSQQTGTAIATELLYRLLFDILNRFIGSFQRLAARGNEEATSFLERKLDERRSRVQRKSEEDSGGLTILEEVAKLNKQRDDFGCPMTGGQPTPPMWVQGVLDGIEEGRMHKEDFQTNQW